MNPKEIITSIVIAMVVMTMFASSAMAAIVVDGDGSDWPPDADCLIVITDPRDCPGATWDNGYDILKVCAYREGNTMYFRIDVDGCPADTDGDCDPDGSSDPAIVDLPGVGEGAGILTREEYAINIDKENDGIYDYTLGYTNNDSSLLEYLPPYNPIPGAVTDEAYGSCVELSVVDNIDPTGFCINGYADNRPDLIGEDVTAMECYTDDDPNAEFSYTGTGCKIVTLDASASWDSEGPIAKFEWDLDGVGGYEIDNGANPIFVADVATTGLHVGTNNIRLQVTDSAGQTHSTNVPQVIVTGDPTATAMANGTGYITLPPGGGTVTLTGTATPYAGTTITSTTWSIPGATPSTGTGLGPLLVSVTDTTTATLTVVASNGCSTPASVLIRVDRPQQDVPLLTLPGLLALIGMMCIVGAGRILTRGRRS